MSSALPIQRGCGSRKEGGVYLECGLSLFGSPIEDLLFDPPLTESSGIPAEWLKPHRTPTLFEHDGVTHVVIWVGADFYPNVFDFIEETRVAGASRRVPKTFDFSKLSPNSRMYFVHAEAACDGTALAAQLAATRDERLDGIEPTGCACPTKTHALTPSDGVDPVESLRCLGLAKRLPTSDVHGYVTSDNPAGRYRTRTLPCGHTYELLEAASRDDVAQLAPAPGVFLQLPLTAITCVTKSDGSFDPVVEQRVRTASGVEINKSDK